MPLNLYHPDDPASPTGELWHFVYLDGMAEDHNSLAAEMFGYGDETAPDLVCVDADQTTIGPGEYDCVLYGKPAIAFIATSRNWEGTPHAYNVGRIVLAEEKRERIDHNSDSRNWR